MKSIFVKEHEIMIDADVFDWASKMNWRIEKRGNRCYAKNNKGSLHRLIMQPGYHKMVDHKNGNGLDNRRENLRICTQAENNMNRRKGLVGSSKYKGVSWKSKNNIWQAAIKINGVSKYLGVFKNELDAAIAYNKAAVIHHGEFANLNNMN